MKRVIYFFTIIIICFTLSSCNSKRIKNVNLKENNDFEILSKVKYPKTKYSIDNVDTSFNQLINEFSSKMIRSIFNESQNEIFSPISLYFALSMLTEGVSSEVALNELEQLLGSDIKSIRDDLKTVFNNNYYSNKNGRTYFANSIWIDKSLNVNDDYITMLKNHYYATSYHVNFKSTIAKENVVKWINHYTEDLLKLSPETYELDSNLVLLLINTLYFHNNWSVEFDKNATTKNVFYTNIDTKVNADFMMHKIDSYYKDTNEYTVIVDHFENGNTITFISPKQGLDVVLNKNLLEFEQNLEKRKIIFSLPKFEINRTYMLNSNLQSYGINEIFKNSNSFNKIAPSLFVSLVRQDVGIKFDEKGVTAASASSIGLNKASLPSDDIIVTLNKPFVYIIKDQTGLPLFIGYLQNPVN